MHSSHMLDRCSWKTELYQQSHAVALQNFLSEWSNTVLPMELSAYFDRICPPTQTWRLGHVHLDLGDIAFDAMAQELPRRLRASLQEAFTHLPPPQADSAAPEADTLAAALQPVAARQSDEDLIFCFLRHGQMPWWHRGTETFLQLWDRHVVDSAPQCEQTVRQLGPQESVRQRLVWQLGEPRVRRLVHVLEPWQGEQVCAFADELFLANARRAAAFSTRQFNDRTWIAILGYLLVDRGTLFNTGAFVRATLERIAQQYRLPFSVILEAMHEALRALAPLGRISTPFLLAIDEIYRHDRADPPTPPVPVDYWAAMEGWLRQPGERVRAGDTLLTLQQVFCALAAEDAQRMARLLRRVGQAGSARQAIVRLFSERELALTVRVLAPQDHGAILAHVAHTSQALLQHNQAAPPKFVWQIMLNYLLAQDMANFQLRQLVGHTLELLCKRHDIDMQVALDLLIFAATQLHPFPHRFQLQQIFCELKAAANKRMPRASDVASTNQPYRQALLDYLLDAREARAVALPMQAIVRQMLVHGSPSDWQAMLPELRARRSDDATLCLRMLRLAGPGNLALLFELVQPGSSGFCLELLSTWQQWRQRGQTASLARLDLALELPALMLAALPGFASSVPARFDAEKFWHALIHLLGKAGVDLAALAAQLHVLAREQLVPEPAGLLRASTSGGELARLWRRWSAPGKAELHGAPPSEGIDLALAWPRHALPAEFRTPEYSPDRLLQQCSALFRHCGYWQGTRAVLEQQLSAVFHQVLMDARPGRNSPAQLLSHMLGNACLRLDIDLGDCLASLAGNQAMLDHTPWQAAVESLRLSQAMQGIDTVPLPRDTGAHDPLQLPARALPERPFTQDHLGEYLNEPRLLSIARHLLMHGRAPSTLMHRGELDLTRLLFDLGMQQPSLLHSLLQSVQSMPDAQFRLQQSMPLAWLLRAMQASAPRHAGTIREIARLHRCIGQMRREGIPRQQLGSMLYLLVLRHWLAHDWTRLDVGHLLNELALQLLCEHGVPFIVLQQAFAPALPGQSLALQAALQQLAHASAPPSPLPRPSAGLAGKLKTILRPERPQAETQAMLVSNAGLVILHGFFEPLCTRLNLMTEGRFHDEHAQRRAVHFLQYLATGHRRTPESRLMLNKVLCGLPLHTPLELEIAMSDSEIAVCESLLESVIQYWSAIGVSSLDGFRGNWLVRNGSLVQNGDHWQLTVEKRVYDILLQHAPFSYSMIRLQWMEKAVHVNWPT